MQSKATGLIITFIAGIAIGVATMAIVQAQFQLTPASQVSTNNATPADTTPPKQGPINSAKDILIPSDALKGTVQSVNGNMITINMTVTDDKGKTITTGITKQIKILSDTEIVEDGVSNPSISTIATDQKISASGLYDKDNVLLVKYLGVSANQ